MTAMRMNLTANIIRVTKNSEYQLVKISRRTGRVLEIIYRDDSWDAVENYQLGYEATPEEFKELMSKYE